ncbi:hypothetical protein E2562_032294 [Oryza meyeriana var. granulata]|uniref:Uncharacterized protein n=1 Tax=Oryza meyeriana var. granulata TaxID=110450 RepID=A0A6G1F0L0_9ORYZ|nr:hypothetical protein E2562_032294 [Oryza meyeriana var. granulata]
MASTGGADALVLLLFMFAAVHLSPAACREVATAEAMQAANTRHRRSSGRRLDGKTIDQGIGYILIALALVFTYVLH